MGIFSPKNEKPHLTYFFVGRCCLPFMGYRLPLDIDFFPFSIAFPPSAPIFPMLTKVISVLNGRLISAPSACIGNTTAEAAHSTIIPVKLWCFWLLFAAAAARDMASFNRASSSWILESVWKACSVARFSYLRTARLRASKSGCIVLRTSTVSAADCLPFSEGSDGVFGVSARASAR